MQQNKGYEDFGDVTNHPQAKKATTTTKGMANTAYEQGFGASAQPNYYQNQNANKMA